MTLELRSTNQRGRASLQHETRCGFLFNHEQLHQAAHSAPIAFELMRIAPRIRTTLFATTTPLFHYLRQSLVRHGLSPDAVQLLAPPPWLHRVSRAVDPFVPFSRVANLLAHRQVFADLDVLVAPEKTSLLLRSLAGLRDLRIVHTRHGAGDREVGFDRHSARFDFVLMSGEKIRDRLAHAGLLKPDGYAIVGYAKFDLCEVGTAPKPRLFPNDRPTVLYNPHCSPRLSSWFRDGRKVLEAFYNCDRYNLIFAPHVMLFRKRVQISLRPLRLDRPGLVPERYRNCPHIHVDLGSERSCDMTYTTAADVYLGDASSQIYEFLHRPRPSVFIDSHDTIAWQHDPNYLHWSTGPVLPHADDLIASIDAAIASHSEFMAAQRALFAYSIDVRDVPASRRSAHAILDYLARTVPLASGPLSVGPSIG